MLKKNDGQVDLFDSVIFDRLIPKDHLLVKIDSIIDFSFVYDLVENQYSPIGRGSKDPVMMVKILLLEYLYNLSDVEVCRQIQTDIVFRWFLGLGIFDEIPDDTTVSHFRVCRLTEDHFEAVFNQILQKCIEYDLVKTNRFIIDSTDVAANTNYPSEKNLVRQAFRKVMKEAAVFNEPLANQLLESIEADIQALYDQSDDPVHWKQHFEITKMYLDKLYLETYEELQHNESYAAAYRLCYDLIDQYQKKAKDKIVSITDPDARVAHKSPGNIKRGYKNHLIVDEDSEIIIASRQTPFNVGDEKELKELVEKASNQMGSKPKEISADKVYGTFANRAYLMDNGITCHIDFYKERSNEAQYFTIKDFNISSDFGSVTCPNQQTTSRYKVRYDKTKKADIRIFYFDEKQCQSCPLVDQCIYRIPNAKRPYKGRQLVLHNRYDAALRDQQHAKTEAFRIALGKRIKVERRFATLVRNRGLRLCRYTGLKGAKIHITLANTAANIVRMVRLLFPEPQPT